MRAAAIQCNSKEDRAENLAVCERLVREAAGQGADLVVLPEKFGFLGAPEAMASAAEPLDGPTITWARGLARELNIDLVAGSIVERREEGDYNTSAHIGADGELHAVYRKIHLFDVDVAGTAYRESETETPGDTIVDSALADGTKIGLSVCYDVRFPELYRILAVRGARVLTIPSAFTRATTLAHWDVLVRARAIENQAFVIAPNQWGSHAPGRDSGGRSMIVNPWGVVLEQAPDGEHAIVTDLDLGDQSQIRERLPALSHRRPAAYNWPQAAIA